MPSDSRLAAEAVKQRRYCYVVYRDRKGEWRWRLKARNGRIVASSAGDGYKRRGDCVGMIEAIEGYSYPIVDVTKRGMKRIVRE